MKIIKFIIKNYRAIEEVEFKLNYSINPIIGINESGKTSILKALLAFDKTRDRLNKGEHLEYQNKYSTKDTRDCTIEALIKLSNQEIDELIKKTNIKTSNGQYDILQGLKENDTLHLIRSLESKQYIYENDGLDENTKKKISAYLVSKLPTILYFDDFTDRVPESIDFPDTYKNDGQLKNSKIREWQEIIEEIFNRAEADGIDENPLKDYMNIGNQDRRDDILSDIQDTLNHEIIDEWKKIKKSSKSFADDSEGLELEIVHRVNKFEFKVKDKAFKGKKRTFSISERSKGFQWFFNYMVKLKFNPNYKKSLENSIFLLDEPGSYLHSSAQGELLAELKRVSKNNSIIFCTHSQFLLNPDVIKLGSIKIAEKKDSKVILESYGNYKSTMDKGALTPVYQALNLNFANDYLGKIIITEGVTDFYLFKMIQKYTKKINNDIKFVPGLGASQSTVLVSLALSFSSDFLILLDNDRAGRNALKKYKKEFGKSIDKKVFIYSQKEKNFLLEDYLIQKDIDELLSLTEVDDIKRGLNILYYDLIDKQNAFINELDMSLLEECFIRFKDLK
jgi:predicted ATP-dependent endonuclease of OLD family